MSVDYLLPAELEQTLYVETKIKQIKRASLIFSQILRDDEQVYCEADVVVVCIKLSTKTYSFTSTEFLELLCKVI